MRKKILGTIVIISLLNLLLIQGVWAEKAFLTDVVMTNSDEHLIVYFTVKDCFTDEMIRAIENGIETTFTFFAKLYERRKVLWNKKLAEVQVRHSIKYDNLKRVYELRLSEKDNEMIYTKDFEEAKKIMATVEDLRVVSLNSLVKGKRYRLKMMAELDKIKLPLYLHNILFFLSLWDFETDWYQIDFRY
ncbi:MAG: DUF4390 domain-containing protein [Deltaproteobacteria bacterium]|nr:DUF4390 domain-containing protein [Deltaproteobacteria bacterium]